LRCTSWLRTCRREGERLATEEQAHNGTLNGGAERWRLAGVPQARGISAWADILATTHLAFDVRATYRTPGRFEGTVTRRRFGDLALVDCAASPFLGDRNLAVMGDHPEEIVGFQFVRKGVELVRESRREIALTAGDVVLWDGLQPTQVEVVEPFVKRTLIFPRERVLAVCPRLADLSALPPMDHNGAAALLVRYLNALAAELPRLDATARGAAADAALELLRAAVEPGVPTSRDARRAALRAEVRRYVRSHLRDPALDPEAIARAHAISVRALHALFEDTGESVAGLVRRERLARCYEDLGLPSGGSVTEIAFRWGFRDAAHFSRVFKREFELTPSEVRHAALEGDGADARIGNGSGAPSPAGPPALN
jgi:AraC family transcriptional activator of tynA and feaB